MDNNTIQTQARICPICIDDHEDTRPCKPADLLARITTLEAQLADRDREAKTTYEMVRLAHFYLIGYRSDSESATHAKRVLANEIIAAKERLALTPAPPTGEEKSSEG